jgi:PTH1 family peptidyl-tRNA hydrolase
MAKSLIAGLGNIGDEYKKTRHNIGFEVILELAKKEKWKFKEKKKLKGEVAEGNIDEKKVYLLKPKTYMNRSGESVKASVLFFKIEIENILVIVDDVNIPFGEFRLKKDSGSGGHKGLENIEEHLGKGYTRLRIGIGRKNVKNLSSYVLRRFTKEENKRLKKIIKEAMEIIYLWLMQGLEVAMNMANVRKSQKKVKIDEK